MLPTKLPAREPLVCDQCRAATLTLTAPTFDDAWREVHRAGWMLMGARAKGAQRWRVLCPACKPCLHCKEHGREP